MKRFIEDEKTEFKECGRGRLPDSFVKTVSAFSNSDGGQIWCGVNDAGQAINLKNKELDRLQVSIASQCKETFNEVITPEIKRTNNHLVVVILPARVDRRPIYIKKSGLQKGSYVRVGASSQLASESILKSLIAASQGGVETRIIEGQNYQNNFTLHLVNDYIKQVNTKNDFIYQNFSQQEILFKIGATDEKGDISTFGLLAFGKDHRVQELLNVTVRIDVTHYGGVGKVDPNNPEATYNSSLSFKGNIKQQFERALNHIMQLIPEKSIVDRQTGFRQDLTKMPEVAVREVLVNSLAHRDYAVYSSKIDVDIYADRLEIINPGTSLVPIEKIETAVSVTRNPLLMSFLKDIGLTEERARGIRTVKAALKELGLREPIFENLYGQFFKATLYNSLLVAPEDMPWLSKLRQFNLNQNQLNALIYLKNEPEKNLTNATYCQINNLTKINDNLKSRREITKLVQLKLLKPVGQNKARYYVLSHWMLKLTKGESNS